VDDLYRSSIQAVTAIPSLGLAGDLDGIISGLPGGLSAEELARVKGAVGQINKTFADGGDTVSGDTFQKLTRRTDSALSPLYNGTPELRTAAWQIKQQMDARAQSAMTADQINDFAQANTDFRSLRTIDAVRNTDGTFTPGDLNAEAKRVRDAYGGPGALDRTAQIGNTVIQPSLSRPSALAQATTYGAGAGAGAAALAPTMAALQKLMTVDLLSTGGAGLGITGGLLGANRLMQAANRRGAPAAIAAAQGGGGTLLPADYARALALLRMPAVAQNQQQQP
jgi:hypothetical protein